MPPEKQMPPIREERYPTEWAMDGANPPDRVAFAQEEAAPTSQAVPPSPMLRDSRG